MISSSAGRLSRRLLQLSVLCSCIRSGSSTVPVAARPNTLAITTASTPSTDAAAAALSEASLHNYNGCGVRAAVSPDSEGQSSQTLGREGMYRLLCRHCVFPPALDACDYSAESVYGAPYTETLQCLLDEMQVVLTVFSGSGIVRLQETDPAFRSRYDTFIPGRKGGGA